MFTLICEGTGQRETDPLNGLADVFGLGQHGHLHFYRFADGSLGAILVLANTPFMAFLRDPETLKWGAVEMDYRMPGYKGAFSGRPGAPRDHKGWRLGRSKPAPKE